MFTTDGSTLCTARTTGVRRFALTLAGMTRSGAVLVPGAVPGPFDSWLALRGTKTLHLRMPRHDANGRAIARWLADKLGDERVIYPGLESHPQHELAKRQMKGFGGMISVEMSTKDAANTALKKFRVFSLAESLGGVESLVSHPASMTHASVPAERRAELGITEGLIRLSCGVEEIDDLLTLKGLRLLHERNR